MDNILLVKRRIIKRAYLSVLCIDVLRNFSKHLFILVQQIENE